jgi:hypothetical protein
MTRISVPLAQICTFALRPELRMHSLQQCNRPSSRFLYATGKSIGCRAARFWAQHTTGCLQLMGGLSSGRSRIDPIYRSAQGPVDLFGGCECCQTCVLRSHGRPVKRLAFSQTRARIYMGRVVIVTILHSSTDIRTSISRLE